MQKLEEEIGKKSCKYTLQSNRRDLNVTIICKWNISSIFLNVLLVALSD